MSKRRKKRRPLALFRFEVGDRVRVKRHVRDTDYPDLPLGGWTGVISQVFRDGRYDIRWSRETLAAIHPVYKKRCERDGLVFEEHYLGDDELEPDPGGPLSIVEPNEIVPRPLSQDDQGDRVRMVFGLTSDDLLPRPDEETLETYYDYLAERLSFPFQARCSEDERGFVAPSPARRASVTGLDEELGWHIDDGILCNVRTPSGEDVLPLTDLQPARADSNRRLVKDYIAWFVGDLAYEGDEDGGQQEYFNEDEEEVFDVPGERTWFGVTLLQLEIVLSAVACGAAMGSAIAVMPWAKWAACIGGALLGPMTAAAMAVADDPFPLGSPRCQRWLGGLTGLISGAVRGAFYGVVAVAFLGAILGGFVGFVLRRLVPEERWPVFVLFPTGLSFAMGCGITAQAFYMNRAHATEGFLYGAATGLAVGVALCVAVLVSGFLLARRT